MGTVARWFKLNQHRLEILFLSGTNFSPPSVACVNEIARGTPEARLAGACQTALRYRRVTRVSQESFVTYRERLAHAFAPGKVSRPKFRAARSLQYFGCRWQRWQVTYTRSVDTKRQCDLQDTSVVIRHRAKHGIPILSGLPPCPCHPSKPILHTCSTCLYVKLEVLVIVWCGGRLTFRNVSSTPPISFQPAVWRRGGHPYLWNGKKEEKIPHLQYA